MDGTAAVCVATQSAEEGGGAVNKELPAPVRDDRVSGVERWVLGTLSTDSELTVSASVIMSDASEVITMLEEVVMLCCDGKLELPLRVGSAAMDSVLT